MGKIGSRPQLLGDKLMTGKLQPVIKGNGLDGKATFTQGFDRSLSQRRGVFRA